MLMNKIYLTINDLKKLITSDKHQLTKEQKKNN